MRKTTPEQSKAHREKNKFEFKYLTARMYGNQRANSRDRGHNPPEYSLEELREWMRSQPQLETLFKNYKESGGDYELAPSIDRLNDEVGYNLSNIQLGTYRENKEREYEKKSKAIFQISLDDEVIKEWSSMRGAARELEISYSMIQRVCCDKEVNKCYKTAGGYKFSLVD